jgi:hypothetical protein
MSVFSLAFDPAIMIFLGNDASDMPDMQGAISIR